MSDSAYAATIAVTEQGGTVTVTGAGSLDFTNSDEFRDGLARAAAAADALVADLRQAVFIDTAILEYLARSAKKMLDRGKRLRVLVSEGSHPLRVLQLSNFGELMDIEAGPADAGGREG